MSSKSLKCIASYKNNSEYHEYPNTIFNKWTKYNVSNNAVKCLKNNILN